MTNQTSNLYNELTFYPAFIKDILEAEKEVIIYSPFISKFRADFFRRALLKLKKRNIAVFIFTRPFEECKPLMREKIRSSVKDYEELGARVFYPEGFMHEKLAIIDRNILWEGSLNILSQRSSKELMRRMPGVELAEQTISFLGISKKLIEAYRLRNLISGAKISFNQKSLTFLTETVYRAIRWSLSIVFQVMIILLKGILLIFKIF